MDVTSRGTFVKAEAHLPFCLCFHILLSTDLGTICQVDKASLNPFVFGPGLPLCKINGRDGATGPSAE